MQYAKKSGRYNWWKCGIESNSSFDDRIMNNFCNKLCNYAIFKLNAYNKICLY